MKALFDPWFTDEIADLGSKDAAIQLAGVWGVEMAELDAMKSGDVSRIKAFISRTHDRYRPPYGRVAVDHPRQCVFCGTVNEDEYLRDPTGERRFWPVKCRKADVPGTGAVREQLWAEAVTRYRNGEKWYLHEANLIKQAADQQGRRQQQHPWFGPIEKWLDERPNSVKDGGNYGGVTIDEMLDKALFKRIETWTDADKKAVAKCVKALGWERYQAGSRREWRYRQGGAPENPR
jgi:predicted P-loop ATPase